MISRLSVICRTTDGTGEKIHLTWLSAKLTMDTGLVRLGSIRENNHMVSFKAIGCVVVMLRTTGDCYKAEEGHWPLTPGEYDVKLMLDDGLPKLAATKLKVVP